MKQKLEIEVGPMTPNNIVGVMLSNRNSWNQVGAFVEIVQRQKKKECEGVPISEVT